MQIKLKELLENMTATEGSGDAAAEPAAEGGGVVETAVEDGPSVATACPPTPRRASSVVEAAIDAATLDAESLAQADFFNPPPDPPRTTTELEAADIEEQPVSHRPVRRNTPPPPPPRHEPEGESDEPAPAAAAASGDDEYEPQTFSPSMLSPLSRRPSGVSEAVKPPRRDSGLIDVRSMAAAYREYDGLSKKKEGRGADVETVPLPILGGGEHATPILLPQPSPPPAANRWLYALVALLAAIVVIGSTVAVTALILKRRDGGARSFAALSPTERAALCEAEEQAARIREDEERIAAARRAPAAVPGAVSDSTQDVRAADLAGTPPAPTPAAALSSAPSASAGPASSAGRGDEGDRNHPRTSHQRDDDGAATASTTGAAPSPVASAPAPAPAAPPSPAPSAPAASDDLAAAAGSATASSSDGEQCDEVTCLVSGKGCCGKNPKGAGARSDEPAPDPSLPARPERADISAGIAAVQGRLQSCGDRHGVRGAVTVKIAIAPSGEVKTASTAQGTAEFQSCVAGALKAARFPATQQGAKVSYPVVLK
jgi:hypothetical protein